MARFLIVPAANTSAAKELLTDSLGRIRDSVDAVLHDLDRSDLTHRIEPEANTIGWLVWHLLRVQDDHFADVAGHEQVWTSEGWFERSGLALDAAATGYGHSPDEVAAVDVAPDLLIGYSGSVHESSLAFIAGLADEDLDRVVDDSWDPPVTLGARIVSVIGDDLKHVGQAEYLKGLLSR